MWSALDQGAQILALENSGYGARHRNRQHLARLIIDAGLVIGAEAEAPNRRVEVRLVAGALKGGL